jgi:hypothetical protein
MLPEDLVEKTHLLSEEEEISWYLDEEGNVTLDGISSSYIQLTKEDLQKMVASFAQYEEGLLHQVDDPS